MTEGWLEYVHDRPGPLYLAIADAIVRAVGNGLLQPGEQLPTQRRLAQQLGVDLSTVTRAYMELQSRGLVAGKIGRGTFLRMFSHEDGPRSLRSEPPRRIVDLSHNFPPNAPQNSIIEELDIDIFREMNFASLAAAQVDRGLRRHRISAAAWLRRFGINAGDEDIIITAGAQHGLLLGLGALTRPGDPVMTEELCFYGLRSAAAMLGRSLVGVRMDDEGLMPCHLDGVCRRTGSRVLYCAPTLHNPTTSLMSYERRQEILKVCKAHDVMIVEDDPYNFLLDIPARPFAALAPECTMHIATLSKVLGPGLRVGFVCAPPSVRSAIGVSLRASTLMASPITVELATRLIDSGKVDVCIGALRREMRARQVILREVLGDAQVRSHPGAFHAWIGMTNDWSADAFVRAAEQQGVAVTPGRTFQIGPFADNNAVRVCLNAAEDQVILRAALRRLGDLLLDHSARTTAAF